MSSQTKQGKTDQRQKHECMEGERNESLLDRQAGQGSTCPGVSWGPGELGASPQPTYTPMPPSHPDSLSPLPKTTDGWVLHPWDKPNDSPKRWPTPPSTGRYSAAPPPATTAPLGPVEPMVGRMVRSPSECVTQTGGQSSGPSRRWLPLSEPPWPPGPFHSLAFPTVTGLSRKI